MCTLVTAGVSEDVRYRRKGRAPDLTKVREGGTGSQTGLGRWNAVGVVRGSDREVRVRMEHDVSRGDSESGLH